MQLIIFGILFAIGIVNLFIIFSDYKEKKIPNKFLGVLFVLGIVLLFFQYLNGQVLGSYFFVQLFLIIGGSFLMYWFGFWGAGDAKYLIVLSLILGEFSLASLIGNISILTLFYLFSYFLYFYGRCLLDSKFGKSIIKNIINDLKEQGYYFLKEGKKNISPQEIILKTITILVEFLIFFTIIRLIRMYVIEDITIGGKSIKILEYGEDILLQSPLGIIIGGILLSISLYILLKTIFSIGKLYIERFFISIIYKDKNISPVMIDIIFISIIFVLLFSFLLYEYIYFKNDILHKLYVIFTLYIGLYFLVKIFIYIYKITFHISEYGYIKPLLIKEGEIIDKKYLLQIFMNEEFNILKKETSLPFKIVEIVQNLENPINKDGVKDLKTLYKNVNSYNKKNNPKEYQEHIHIRTIHTFAFSTYLYGGAVITYLYNDAFIRWLIRQGIYVIKELYTLF